jgi:hypothetical protein
MVVPSSDCCWQWSLSSVATWWMCQYLRNLPVGRVYLVVRGYPRALLHPGGYTHKRQCKTEMCFKRCTKRSLVNTNHSLEVSSDMFQEDVPPFEGPAQGQHRGRDHYGAKWNMVIVILRRNIVWKNKPHCTLIVFIKRTFFLRKGIKRYIINPKKSIL